MTQKVAFKTIGCKVNQYETGCLRGEFIKNGYQVVDFQEKADIYIINTCAVTREAERKSKQMTRKAVRLNPDAAIIVTGCGVESDLHAIKACKGQKYYIISNYYKDHIYALFHSLSPSLQQRLVYFKPAAKIISYPGEMVYSNINRTRGFVKIQDGCNQFCSYCLIPYLRGRSRSRSPRLILSEINRLAGSGCKEVVLLGINLGSYGKEKSSGKTFLLEIIESIQKISGIERVRLSSIELPWITNDFIEAFKRMPKLCHHLHIPLQSGDDGILNRMNRQYTTEEFKNVVKKIREQIPDIAITTDVIVGFPGEDDKKFCRSLQFINDIAFAKVHVFPYSDRPFSLASLLPFKVETNTIKRRMKKLLALSKKLRIDFLQKNVGRGKSILVEYQEDKNGQRFSYGLTDNYIPVCLKNSQTEKGELVKIILNRLQKTYLEGERINRNNP